MIIDSAIASMTCQLPVQAEWFYSWIDRSCENLNKTTTPQRMWLKVSLCVSLVWLLVGRAGGSGSPGTCKGAQDLYVAVSSAQYTSEQLNAVSINPAGKIFDEPSGGMTYSLFIAEQERGFHVTSQICMPARRRA